MKRRQQHTLRLCLGLGLAASARADVVSDWNVIALQAIAASQPPPGGSVFLYTATVHLAVHDAVAAIDGQFRPYSSPIPRASGSPVAAAAKAAHDVLVNKFPGQAASLDKTYGDYLTKNGLAPNNAGVAVGEQAAARIIKARAKDGSFPPSYPDFNGGTGIGVWRPTPPASRRWLRHGWLTLDPSLFPTPHGSSPPPLLH
jgi:hypothetical protein